MTSTEHEVPLSDAGNPIGFGRMLRKEDARFLRGRGNYLDDVTMPGMLHGAILASPYAHARIRSIDTSAAEAHPKVKAVITGAVLDGLKLAWMPTLSADVQAVLATDKVRYQGQEVAFVIAEDRYSARDALELIDVDYEPLPPMIDARRALDADAPLVRDEIEGRTDNRIFDWEAGDAAATDAAFAGADVTVALDVLYPRSHPAPMETCGSVAYMDPVTGKLTAYITSQAPHAHRTVYALVAGIPEHKIQVISPDIGGGFGNKVPIYPGYVLAVVGSIVTKRPVKWMEDRSSNLMTTGFARDYHMHGEIAATSDGKIVGVKVDVIADHGAFNATAQPTKYPAGFFHIFTGSYDYGAAHCKVTGVYTNKAPGGVAYACSFRITEAVYLIERIVDRLADELGMDPAELRLPEPAAARAVPVHHADRLGVRLGRLPAGAATRRCASPATTNCAASRPSNASRGRSGNPTDRTTWASACRSSPRVSAPARASTWTSSGSAWPTDATCASTRRARRSCGCRCRPRARATRRRSPRSSATSSGIPPEDIEVIHGDTDNTPFGLGTYGSRSTPVSGAAAAVVAQRVRDKARIIAAASLECSPEDLEWQHGRWQVVGDPAHGKTMAEIAMLAHSNLELPEGVEGHLDAQVVYDPPNLTYPFGAYICVVDVDPGTGVVKVRRFIAVDDCGPRINPMIVEGQIHGGLADGIGMALMQAITFDEDGNCLGGSFMDYLLPTSMEVPNFELGETVTPSPHHPLGVKGVGESATVGSPPAVVNAVIDALKPFGVREVDMPLTPAQVWLATQGRPARTDLAFT